MPQTSGIAIGENASASAVNSIAIGDNTTAAAGHVALNTFDTMDAQGNIIPARLGAVTGGLSFLSSSATTADIIAAYNAMLTAMGKPPPPYDAEIEYLESSGTQYIDIGIVADNNLSIWCRLSLPNTSVSNAMGATVQVAGGGYLRHHLNMDNGIYRYFFGTLSVSSNVPWVANTPVNLAVDAVSKEFRVDNSAVSLPTATFNTNIEYRIFGRNGMVTNPSMRIYSFSASNGTDSVDFIPVRVGSVGYMYDRVSGQLFGNAGTGSFVLGPDV